MSNYNDESIDQLEGAERVRTRPNAVFGSSGVDGARHGVTELIGNALDEASAGFGDKIDITYYKDGGVSIRDYGRGVPMGYNSAKKVQNWFLVFNEMYAGGKYEDHQKELKAVKDWNNFNPKEYNYLYSIGLNGLGAASTQYSSKYFNVTSYRNGVATTMNFKHGYPILTINGEELHVTSDVLRDLVEQDPEFDIRQVDPKVGETDEPNGTFIHWRPDDLVFTNTDIGLDFIRLQCDTLRYIGGMEVTLTVEETGEVIEFPKSSITDYAREVWGKEAYSDSVYTNHLFTHGKTVNDNIYVCETEIAVILTQKDGRDISHHNNVRMNGGAHQMGVDLAIDDFFITIGKEQGIKLQASDYNNRVGVVVNAYSNIASYRGQTKDKVDDTFITLNIKKSLLDLLRTEYSKGLSDFKSVVEDVLNEARIRIELQTQQKALKDVLKTTKSRELPEKFIPSKNFQSRKFDNSELWIAEGDSAGQCIVDARDGLFQSVYFTRGKLRNALKASLIKVTASKEIKELFTLLRTGMEIQGLDDEDNVFDITQSRFDKIVISTDADEDGFQIRVLWFCVFWKLAPQLLKEGMVYIAQSPKFQVELNTGEKLYAVNDEEFEALKTQYPGQIVQTKRFKGLGQVNPEILAETTVDPETRRMLQIKLDPNDYELHTVVEALFGRDPFKRRKEALMHVLGKDVIDMFEESSEFMNLIDKGVYEDELEEVESVS